MHGRKVSEIGQQKLCRPEQFLVENTTEFAFTVGREPYNARFLATFSPAKLHEVVKECGSQGTSQMAAARTPVEARFAKRAAVFRQAVKLNTHIPYKILSLSCQN